MRRNIRTAETKTVRRTFDYISLFAAGWGAFAVLGTITLTGCGGSSDDDKPELARARLLNGLTGIPAPGTITVTGQKGLEANNLALAGATSYSVINEGTYTPIVKRSSDNVTIMLTASQAMVELKPNQNQTIIPAGIADGSSTADMPRLLRFPDDFPTMEATQSGLRLVHLARGFAEPVDLRLRPIPEPTATPSPTPTPDPVATPTPTPTPDPVLGMENIAADNASNFIPMKSGKYLLQVLPTNGGAVLDEREVTLYAGRYYTVLVLPNGAGGIRLRFTDDPKP